MTYQPFSLLRFTNLDSFDYDFIPNAAQRVRSFSPSVQMRGEQRPQMQMHGRHPVAVYADALQIHHEGVIRGADAEDVLDERALMLSVLGDLSTAPPGTSMGTLTIKKANMTENASAPATLEGWEANITHERVVSVEYMFSWVVFTPYFVGDDTDNLFYL